MTHVNDYNTPINPTWCPGCGNFALWNSLKQALLDLELDPHEVVLTFDIGCSSNMADKINTYAIKSLHGRSVPAAIGVKIANPEIPVIAIGGDGGIMEEGINHLMWAARSNYDMTVLMHNNQIFGLTTGQPTTTTTKGQAAKTAPLGVVENQIIPAHVALVSNASFVARVFAEDTKYVTKIIKEAVRHKGFAFVEFLQPCITFNKLNTFKWFRERVYKLDERKNYDPSDWDNAIKVSKDTSEKIATGIIYKRKRPVPYSERLAYRKDVKTTPVDEVKEYSIKELIKEFK